MRMSKHPLVNMQASRIFAISRRTWILVSVALLMLEALAIWMTISLADSLAHSRISKTV
jgi:hypothetical protein